jgi:hypothetical protein
VGSGGTVMSADVVITIFLSFKSRFAGSRGQQIKICATPDKRWVDSSAVSG